MNKTVFHYYLFQGEELINSKSGTSTTGWVICLPGDITKMENELLNKILQSVNVDPRQKQTINLEEISFSWENFKSAKILAFGCNLPNGSNLYYQIDTMESNSYIQADKLQTIAESVELKQKLWKALKDLS